jgi:predicted Zn-dependent protease
VVQVDVSHFFYNLGRHWGHKAVPVIRKSKLIWDGVAGSEEEAFRAEVALGTEMAAELRATVGIIDDVSATAGLDEICLRLATHARDKRRTFRCALFRDNIPNAIALPGGLLFFSDSLLALCEQHRDDLAFVAGHEMAHVLLGHTWDRMINEAALHAASMATARLGQLGAWLRQQGIALLRSAHERDLEFKADELGFRLAVAAGFDPSGALNLLGRIQEQNPDRNALGHYLASHPPASERSARLRTVLQRIGG